MSTTPRPSVGVRVLLEATAVGIGHTDLGTLVVAEDGTLWDIGAREHAKARLEAPL